MADTRFRSESPLLVNPQTESPDKRYSPNRQKTPSLHATLRYATLHDGGFESTRRLVVESQKNRRVRQFRYESPFLPDRIGFI
eukprot:4154162-Heterocapsa_arctica.AAC.1